MQRLTTVTCGTIVGTALAVLGYLSAPAAENAGAAHSSATHSPKECRVHCIDPHPACDESAKVIETIKLMCSLLSKGDLTTYAEYLADDCTTFDENTGKLIVGKTAVLADLKRRLLEISPDGKDPALSITLEEPYAKVTGDTAVVTFRAIKEVGGAHPGKEEVKATDVFVKHGDKWQKLHFRGEHKKII